MRDLTRLKREMLREAVRENVDLAESRFAPRSTGRRRHLKTAVRLLAVLVVPAALFVSINAISGGGTRPEVVLVSAAEKSPKVASEIPAASLARPRRIEPSVFRLAVETVALDPGHGGADPGAKTASGLTEKEVTLDIGRRLRDLLKEASFKVVMTRDEDRTLSLHERSDRANASHADLFVSIHVNSIPVAERRGVETYYLGPTDDPHVNRLAGEENRGAGYSMADYRKLLEGIYVDVRQDESRRLAQTIQGGLFGSLRREDAVLQDRGVKSAPFVVLVASEMPGVLAEVSCISNEEEARRLADPSYRQTIARALLQGIRTYAEARNRPGTPGT